jgi:AcrR family transcriptional regulator
MTQSNDNSEARERVLDAAERLFAERGYKPVTLRDIAAEVGIRHTSLYHHVPEGKEQLFIEVTERNLARHRQGLTTAIARAELEVQAQLRAVADWLLSQPPLDTVRMTYSDMPAIDVSHRVRLSDLAYESLVGPVAEALLAAQNRGEIAHHDMWLVAGGLVGMIGSLHSIPEEETPDIRRTVAYEMLDILLRGLRPR